MPAGRPTKYDPKYCDEVISNLRPMEIAVNAPDFLGVSGVYALHCPTTLRVRYIGQSKDIGKRIRRHKERPPQKNTHYVNWRKSLESAPLFSVVKETDDRAALEVALIGFARKCGMDLVNTTDGGESPPTSGVYGLCKKLQTMYPKSEKLLIAIDDLKSAYNAASLHDRICMDGKCQQLLDRGRT